MFKGSITALITPFDESGAVDWQTYQDLIEWQIECGTAGVVPCGTTGESPTLSHAEHKELVKRCVKIVNGRIPVIAGTGSNSTAEAIELTQEAKDDGADAALVVTPYYNKPTAQGLLTHYKKIAEAVDFPIIVYNIPGRSVVDIKNDLMGNLANLPHIVGVKDATADLSRPPLIKRHCGNAFCQLSGEDATAVAYRAMGGDGCISVTANVAPALLAEMHKAWDEGNIQKVREIDDRLAPLHRALFLESSPAPVKYATSRLGRSGVTVRAPLCPLQAETCRAVDEALEIAGLI